MTQHQRFTASMHSAAGPANAVAAPGTPSGVPPPFEFKLFVAGASPRSARAVANLSLLCERALPGAHRIEVIDVVERPDLGEQASVLATPMVMRLRPLPVRRAVGDFADLTGLAAAMELPDPDDRGDDHP